MQLSHHQWLALYNEGHCYATQISNHGYLVQKKPGALTWIIWEPGAKDYEYVLCYVNGPTPGWQVLAARLKPKGYQRIKALFQSLKAISEQASKSDLTTEDILKLERPWVIARYCEIEGCEIGLRPIEFQRFSSRAEAERHLRFLQRSTKFDYRLVWDGEYIQTNEQQVQGS